MTSPAGGYEFEQQELSARVTALGGIGEQTSGLAASARQLAEQVPKLGTAPPALHLAMRLREAVGGSGLTGEINAADTELNSFHNTLHASVSTYLDADADIERAVRAAGGDTV